MTTVLGAAALAAPVRAAKECSFLLPESLGDSLGRLHPGAQVLSLNQLRRSERRLFKKAEGRRCPGIVHLDFFGDHREAYGVVLVTGAAAQRRLRLILASRMEGASAWKIETLDTRKDPGLATVAKEPPGVYEDIHHKKKIQASAETLLWVCWGKSTILYAWTGEEIDKIWLKTSAPNRSPSRSSRLRTAD